MSNISASYVVVRTPVVCSADNLQEIRCFSKPTDNIGKKRAFSEENEPSQQVVLSKPALLLPKLKVTQKVEDTTIASRSSNRLSVRTRSQDNGNLEFPFSNDAKKPAHTMRWRETFKSNAAMAGMDQTGVLGYAAMRPKSTDGFDNHASKRNRKSIWKIQARNWQRRIPKLRSDFKEKQKYTNADRGRDTVSSREAGYRDRHSKGLDRYHSNRRSKVFVNEEGTPPGEKGSSADSHCIICLSELGDQRTESCCCCGAKVCPACVMSGRIHHHLC